MNILKINKNGEIVKEYSSQQELCKEENISIHNLCNYLNGFKFIDSRGYFKTLTTLKNFYYIVEPVNIDRSVLEKVILKAVKIFEEMPTQTYKSL